MMVKYFFEESSGIKIECLQRVVHTKHVNGISLSGSLEYVLYKNFLYVVYKFQLSCLSDNMCGTARKLPGFLAEF